MSDMISRDSLVEKIRAEMADVDKRSIEASEKGDDVGRFGFLAMYKLYGYMQELCECQPDL